ncbi:MAG: tryptophan synthase subunit alpha [Phycisphaerae bacterium]
MNRLSEAFAKARGKGRKMLCPFLTAGYPSLEVTADLLLAAQEAGADVVEVGIPFSDPVADGPVIQASYTHALARGATVKTYLGTIAAARKKGVTIPLAAMVSFSIIFKRGTEEFAKACADSGVDGLILPDVPLEEAPAIVDAVREAGLRSTLLVAPTSPASRRAAIARLCDGFVYYLSVSGITGERRALPADVGPNVAELRKVTEVPICVGFGISTAEQVREVTQVADGAIVGSALIRRLTEVVEKPVADQCAAAGRFIKELAAGLR